MAINNNQVIIASPGALLCQALIICGTIAKFPATPTVYAMLSTARLLVLNGRNMPRVSVPSFGRIILYVYVPESFCEMQYVYWNEPRVHPQLTATMR